MRQLLPYPASTPPPIHEDSPDQIVGAFQFSLLEIKRGELFIFISTDLQRRAHIHETT